MRFAKNIPLIFLFLAALFLSLSPMSYAVGDTSEDVTISVIEDIQDTTEEEITEYEPVEGEITEGQYRAYVMGCLTFFVVVILFYFAAKFFLLFF